MPNGHLQSALPGALNEEIGTELHRLHKEDDALENTSNLRNFDMISDAAIEAFIDATDQTNLLFLETSEAAFKLEPFRKFNFRWYN